ncbi:MAG: hypothetical protein ABIF01_04515 [Candidatus Micrarchaeota archaeon]
MQGTKLVRAFNQSPDVAPRAILRKEPESSDILSQHRLMVVGSYLSGLIRAKDRIIEEKPGAVLFPLRGAWPLAKTIQLAASIDRQSSQLPTFKYPPFSSHYFSKRTSAMGDIFSNKRQIVFSYMQDVGALLERAGNRKLMVIDEVLSGSSLTGTYELARAFLNQTYGKSFELTVVGICDQTHIAFSSPKEARAEQVLELSQRGEIVFGNSKIIHLIKSGRMTPGSLRLLSDFNSGKYFFTNETTAALVRSGEISFRNPRFNALVKEGKIDPIIVAKLFTTDSKHFLYGLQKSSRVINGEIAEFPVYSAGAFDKRVYANMQLLLKSMENILSPEHISPRPE